MVKIKVGTTGTLYSVLMDSAAIANTGPGSSLLALVPVTYLYLPFPLPARSLETLLPRPRWSQQSPQAHPASGSQELTGKGRPSPGQGVEPH